MAKVCALRIGRLTKCPLLKQGPAHYIGSVTKKETEMDIRKTFKKWAAYQQTVRELNSLDNRQLNDLGISRADIQRIARDHASTI